MTYSLSAIVPDPLRPILVAGERLTSEEFLARYERMPYVRARLINGIVFFKEGGPERPVPLVHGERTAQVGAWLGRYEMSTEGISAALNATVDLVGHLACIWP